ncbi:NAD(P)H-dependent oxidoreductase [Tateyamaria sp. ANG-S1]|uniref:FMN-dependent NADH-azoreductase n=1 Tax=Tateyamaria sp. ANG-S1 TaxID=1577905 RepID=UPI00057FAA18|nr:NAD(P)H-dependent oxidoreductase [Tateyamaria sp. ANG-S1]KIC51954.1 FMN-dependent NADH-azoreductase [Tateyamaria sp. ANG-S1]
MTILHIDSSARTQGSVTRDLSAQIVAKLGSDVIRRDLSEALPQINEAWVNANFTPADDRDPAQRDTLALSDTLVEELKAADTIVIGAPVYNFGIPAALKAWIDLVARAGLTFKYTETGPVGLLNGKRAIIAVATGGTPVGSDIDFATDYLKHVMGFIGIHEVEVIAADRVMAQGEEAIAEAKAEIEKLAA